MSRPIIRVYMSPIMSSPQPKKKKGCIDSGQHHLSTGIESKEIERAFEGPRCVNPADKDFRGVTNMFKEVKEPCLND